MPTILHFRTCILTALLLFFADAMQGKTRFAIVSLHNRSYHKVIDTAGNLLVDSILAPSVITGYADYRYDEGVFRFQDGGRYGYRDIHNHILLAAVCDNAEDFADGAGIATLAGRMGLVDASGNWAIPPSYLWLVRADTNGTFLAIDSEGYISLMTKSGRPVLNTRVRPYAKQPRFSDGLLAVTYTAVQGPAHTGVHVGFIDLQGRLVLDTVWENDPGMWFDARSRAYRDLPDICGTGMLAREQHFRDHPHGISHDYYRFEGGRALVRQHGRNIVIDRLGKALFEPPQDIEQLSNSGGFFSFVVPARAGQPKMYGLLNRSGTTIRISRVPPKSDFVEGLMVVREGPDWECYLDTTGELAFGGRRFLAANAFQSGMAPVIYYDSVSGAPGTVAVAGFLLRNGRVRRRDSVDAIVDSDNGWRRYRVSTGQGFLNGAGKVVIPAAYLSLTRFRSGYCGFSMGDDPEKSGYINEKNKIVVPAIYDDVWDFVELRRP